MKDEIAKLRAFVAEYDDWREANPQIEVPMSLSCARATIYREGNTASVSAEDVKTQHTSDGHESHVSNISDTERATFRRRLSTLERALDRATARAVFAETQVKELECELARVWKTCDRGKHQPYCSVSPTCEGCEHMRTPRRPHEEETAVTFPETDPVDDPSPGHMCTGIEALKYTKGT